MPSGEEKWEKDLMLPDPRARTRDDLDSMTMREIHSQVKSLKDLLKEQHIGVDPAWETSGIVRVDMGRIEESFKELGQAMKGIGEAANRAMTEMMKVAMLPHQGGWIPSVGWVCERCGAESMDLDLMREVDCSE